MNQNDGKLIKVGLVTSSDGIVKVVRNGEEIILKAGDALYSNDLVISNDSSVLMEFLNGREFTLDVHEEVLLDDAFSVQIESNDEEQEDSTIVDSINKESHPYYVKSHSLADKYTESDSQMTNINAKILDSAHNSENEEAIHNAYTMQSGQPSTTTPQTVGNTHSTTPTQNAIPQGTPQVTPGVTQQTPNATPTQVPTGTPGQTPNLTQQTPNATPQGTPGTVQQTPIQNATPQGTPQGTPQQTPTQNAIPQGTPQVTPGVTQQTPNATPTQVPTGTPGQTPNLTQQTPNATPLSTPGIMQLTPDNTPPIISIDAIATDNVINATEHNASLSITGKTDAETGQEVSVFVNGIDYKATVTNGTFTISVSATAVGAFTDGQNLNITAKVTDKAGNSSTPATAQLNVDTSINATADTATTTEDATTAISGSVITNDDHTNGETVKATTSLQTAHGVYTLKADGTYTFTVDNAASQSLAQGKSATDTLTYEITDKAGNTTTAILTTTITGSNDGAVITQSPVDVTEDTNQTATIHLGITDADADAGEAHFTAATLTGAHGTATLATDGTLVYTLDNSNAQHLNAGQSITDTIQVISADGTTKDVTVTIHGTNDIPTINAITAQSANEDGSQVTGQISVTDVDKGDTATYATTSKQTGFTLNADGSYTLDPTDNSFQHLAVGETQVITIAVTATDTHSGISAPQNLVITITGTNDIPVVSAPITLPVGTEDLTQTITSAQLIANTTDVDTKDTLSIANVKTDHGTLTTDTSGTVHFTPEANYNGKVTFTYDVTDSHGGTVQTTATTDLTALDDLIQDSGARDLGATDEDTAKHFSEADLLKNLSDADGALHVSATPTSTHGTITGNATNGYTFTPNANFHGDNLDISYKVSDGTTEYAKTAHLDVTSVTDAATVALSMTAEQQVMDFGHGNPAAYAKVDGVSTGTLDAMSAEITFVLDAKNPPSDAAVLLNYSKAGATSDDQNLITFWKASSLQFAFMNTVVSPGINLLDGQTHRLTMTWESSSGDLKVYDNGQIISSQVVHQGDHLPAEGSFIVGTRTHTVGGLDNPANYNTSLSAGGRVFAATMVDHVVSPDQIKTSPISSQKSGVLVDIMANGQGQIIDTTGHHTIVAGAQNAFVNLAVDTTAGEIPNGALIHLNPTITPALDADDTIVKVEMTGFIKGTILDDENGHTHTVSGVSENVDIAAWTKSSITAQLPKGVIANMNVELIATTEGPDGKTATASTHTSLILDANAPIPDAQITGDDDKTTDEDTAVSGVLQVTDADATQAHFDTTPVNGKYGQLTMTTDGHWTFTPNAAANALNVGDKVDDVISVKSADGTTHEVAIHLTGTNDAPTVSTQATVLSAGNEDTTITISKAELLANITDADKGETATLKVENIKAEHGVVSVDATTGVITYTPETNYNGAVKFTYDVVDTHGSTISTSADLTVTSVNDVPEITSYKPVDLGSTNEDTIKVFTAQDLLASVKDVDGHNTLSVKSVSVDSKFGTISDDGHGNYTFHPKANYYGTDVPLNFVATDGYADVKGEASLDVIAVNDGANWGASGGYSFGHIGGNHYTLDGLVAPGRIVDGEHITSTELHLYDSNGDHSMGYKGLVINDIKGNFYIFAGTKNEKVDLTGWDLTAIHVYPPVSATGYSFAATAWISTSTGTRTVSFNSGDYHDQASVTEDKDQDVSGFLDAHPSDGKDVGFKGGHFDGTYGSLDLQPDGNWKYTLSQAKSDSLNDGDLKQDIFTVSTTTGETHNITLDINGHTDVVVAHAAQISGDDTKTTDEDTAVSGVLQVTDADASQAHFDTTPVDGKYGQLTMTTDGHWTFTPNAAANALSDGDKVDDKLIVKSADGTEHEIMIHLTGADEVVVTTPAPPVTEITMDAMSSILATMQDAYGVPSAFPMAKLVQFEETAVHKQFMIQALSYGNGELVGISIDGQLITAQNKSTTTPWHDIASGTYIIPLDSIIGHDVKYIVSGPAPKVNYTINDLGDDYGRFYTHSDGTPSEDAKSHRGVVLLPSASVSHDEALSTDDLLMDQINIDLDSTDQHISKVMTEMDELRVLGKDVSDTQDKLDDLVEQKHQLLVEKEELEHPQEVQQEVEHHDSTQNVVPEHDADMPSLDNVAQHLESAKITATEVPHEALATAAILLSDTTATTDSHSVIKAVENQEPKEHVKNPDAPENTNTADTNDDTNAVQDTQAEVADYVPDAHNQMPDEYDQNDGTGLTS